MSKLLLLLGTLMIFNSSLAFAGSDKKTFDAPISTVYEIALGFVVSEWDLLDADTDKKIEFRASRTCEGIAIFRVVEDEKTEVVVSTRKRQALVTWGEGGKKAKQLFKEIEKSLKGE